MNHLGDFQNPFQGHVSRETDGAKLINYAWGINPGNWQHEKLQVHDHPLYVDNTNIEKYGPPMFHSANNQHGIAGCTIAEKNKYIQMTLQALSLLAYKEKDFPVVVFPKILW